MASLDELGELACEVAELRAQIESLATERSALRAKLDAAVAQADRNMSFADDIIDACSRNGYRRAKYKDQAAFIESACAERAELKAQVERLETERDAAVEQNARLRGHAEYAITTLLAASKLIAEEGLDDDERGCVVDFVRAFAEDAGIEVPEAEYLHARHNGKRTETNGNGGW
jgi:outer membrane murein-binding lipoprotein Lpp